MNKEKRYTLVVEQRLYDALGAFAKESGITKIDACATLLDRGLKSRECEAQELNFENCFKFYIELPENKKRRFKTLSQMLEHSPEKKESVLKTICENE